MTDLVWSMYFANAKMDSRAAIYERGLVSAPTLDALAGIALLHAEWYIGKASGFPRRKCDR